MLIDWYTVAAQGVNFIILVGLLQHFLYKPILAAIDAREKHIAGELADAAGKQAAARQEREELQAKNQAFDEQRAGLLAKAATEAGAERDRLVGAAQQKAAAFSAEQLADLRRNLASLSQEITRQASEEVLAISRQALADLATASLEERMGEVFIRRVHELNGPAKETLGAAIRGSPDAAILRSAFAVPPAERAAIENALNQTFATAPTIRYETDAGLLCGIELSVNGQRIGWSIADYVTSLNRRVGAILAAEPAPSAAPAVAK